MRVVATYGSARDRRRLRVRRAAARRRGAWRSARDGRIRIGGPTLFDGYDGDPELTAEVLVDGWFLTSDAGRLDEDGRLQVLGRLDDVVVSGGVNVPTPAVAAPAARAPGRRAAEVLGVPDEEWGHRVVAFVVGAADARGGPRLGRRRRTRARGRRAQLVVLDELPLLANGKLDRLRAAGAACERRTCGSGRSRCAPASAASRCARAC